MTEFIKSLRRLFQNGKIAVFKLEELKKSGKISNDEFGYIIATKKVGD